MFSAVLVLLCLLLGALAAGSFLGRRRAEAALAAETDERTHLQAEVDRLTPYARVADADAEARRLVVVATAKAAAITAAAQSEAGALRTEADALRTEARNMGRDARTKADALLAAAGQNAARIVADARVEAERIAGDALKAMQNADRWAATEQAMRNVIQGYGDAYLKPARSVLDDLAADFDHKQAGRELKLARERSRLMVASGRAATCDYVEAHRRDTAIRFVVDAFNGKVDALLSRLRSVDIGTASQQISDAFALVNHNGAAFRNARILPEYLSARMAEVRWAVGVMALREAELEEQREIKARLREEEKAQREFERAQREAAKEEAQLRKAMERAEGLLARARDDERAQFEAKLAELQAKLAEAEARSQRATSMAELTLGSHARRGGRRTWSRWPSGRRSTTTRESPRSATRPSRRCRCRRPDQQDAEWGGNLPAAIGRLGLPRERAATTRRPHGPSPYPPLSTRKRPMTSLAAMVSSGLAKGFTAWSGSSTHSHERARERLLDLWERADGWPGTRSAQVRRGGRSRASTCRASTRRATRGSTTNSRQRGRASAPHPARCSSPA